MLNTFLLNTNLLNKNAVPAVATQDDIVFNLYGLQNSSIITSILRQDNMPRRDFERRDVPRGDGRFVVGDYMREKNIKMQGIITKSTSSLLEAEIDAMKKALAKLEGVLDIKIDGVVRRYIATLVNGDSMFDRRGTADVTKVPFDLDFATVEPFGKSRNYASETSIDQTSLALNEQADNAGTTRAKAIAILNFTAANSISAISFKNNTRGEEIKITESISASDYVVFDGENMEVTINGVVVDYEGTFPEFDAGANSVTFTLTGTSATYTLTMKHKTPYL